MAQSILKWRNKLHVADPSVVGTRLDDDDPLVAADDCMFQLKLARLSTWNSDLALEYCDVHDLFCHVIIALKKKKKKETHIMFRDPSLNEQKAHLYLYKLSTGNMFTHKSG